jgi:hypothetical protein
MVAADGKEQIVRHQFRIRRLVQVFVFSPWCVQKTSTDMCFGAWLADIQNFVSFQGAEAGSASADIAIPDNVYSERIQQLYDNRSMWKNPQNFSLVSLNGCKKPHYDAKCLGICSLMLQVYGRTFTYLTPLCVLCCRRPGPSNRGQGHNR